MNAPKSFKVGEAPWETKPQSFKVGEAPWEKSKSANKKESKKLEAALEGLGEGATLGYLNNIQAALEKPVFGALNKITGQDVEADDYVTARDYYNKRQERLKESNPGSFTAGQVVGTIASSMPIAKAAQGATVAARALKAAGAGAAYGGIQNTSETEGETGDVNLKERAINTGVGALTGAASSLGADAIAKGVKSGLNATSAMRQKAGEKLKDVAERMSFKSTGAMLKDFRSADAKGEINEIGRWLLDKGYIKPGTSVDDIAKLTLQAKQSAGEAIDAVYTNAEESLKTALSQKGFDPIRDKQRIIAAARKELGDTVGAENAINKLSAYLDDVAAKHGDEPYQAALKKFSVEKQKYISEVKQYRKDLGQYRRQVGKAGENVDQELLPAFTDDLQRTGTKQKTIELQGKPSAKIEAEPYEPWTQQDLVPLPQRPQGAFNPPRGDDLLPMAQKMELDQRYLNELGDGYQSEILNARLTPRTFAQGSVPTTNQGSGQLQFAIKPTRPVRPEAPKDVRNAMTPRRSNEIKGAIDDEINYARNPLNKEPATEKAFYGARSEINKIVQESIEDLGGSAQVNALKSANKEYGLASKANRMANDRVNRESANKILGLTDTITAGAGATYGAVTGDWQTAAVALAGKKAIEKYGVTGLAVMADRASKALLKQPTMAKLAQTNPNAFKATVFSLVENSADKLNIQKIQNFPKAADNKPLKGEEKWASDGAKKLIDSGIDPEIIEKIKSDKKGKRLLIEASDVKPDSKAMQSIINKIRTGYLNKGDQ
ncbi:MAG: hypothetical protein JNL11_17520 [Bdellovibrionaceae bacterium]|nr:hypothetical protein [Pseudobdellovibrionaceae bacterium]